MITTRYVLDTSVAVAWYLPETFAVAARRWHEKVVAGAIELFVPSLHDWEFANVLRTYVRRGELDRVTAEEIQAVHLEAPLKRSDAEQRAVLTAAFAHECTVYDAVYITLAAELDCGLITAERSTTPWVVRLGERVQLVK
jgi:predicted nucleic acid-binding protein